MTKADRLRASVHAAVAIEVAAGRRHDRPSKATVASIHAEAQQALRKRMQEAGIQPIRIPQREKKLQSAICALFRHLGEGRVPSASRAAWEVGTVGEQAKKLAYRVRVESEAVSAGICVMGSDPFVRRLQRDRGWMRQVVSGHKSLGALATTLKNAHLSLGGKTEPGGKVESRSRGAWHAEARALRAEGWSGNRIARRLDQKLKTVETFLARDRKRT